MRHQGRFGWIRTMAVAWAAALAVQVSLPAAEWVTLSDGSLLTVWEVRTPSMRTDTAPATGGFLSWSIRDASGTRGGIVPPTGDLVPDAEPRLVLDPATGTVFLLWSRAETGVYTIHYARFDGAGWVDAHALTFGSGNDRLPRVGFDRTGATLFWVDDARRYFHAPFDPGFGRLYAVPRQLDHFQPGRPAGARIREDDGLFTNGGIDSPVPPGGKTCKNGCGASVWPGTSSATSTQGGQDSPVPPTKGGNPKPGGGNASAWGVAGNLGCRSQVLVIPSQDLTQAFVMRFDRGAVRFLNRIDLPSPVPDGHGDRIARTYLPTICR